MKSICITGASSGIGWASAVALAKSNPGSQFFLGARRLDRLQQLAKQLREEYRCQAHAIALDLAKEESIREFCDAIRKQVSSVDILLNNGGGAHGLHTVADGDLLDWHTMMDVNFFGALLMTKHLIPGMIEQRCGHIINLGSIAAQNAYEGGSVYCASKAALLALTKTLKLELNGKNIRVSSIDPGLVETDFSMVRFKGDQQRATKVYEGLKPLTAEDIADIVCFVANAPAHVNVDQIIVTPTAQATVYKTHREV
jgi:3-hydroxy acid dehydrogenase/malonic semialdehyde reductase